MDPKNQYDAFSLMRDMTEALRQAMHDTYEKIRAKEGIAVFMHGSPSRNEMTSYSDIDILIADRAGSAETKQHGNLLLTEMGKFGFGKVDEQGWRDPSIIEQYARHSMVDGNKVLDAKFVCGEETLRTFMRGVQERNNTIDRAMKNIVFQKFYLEHYYSNRSSDIVPNVKYGNGGYRDFLMYNWFDNAMHLGRGEQWKRNANPQDPQLKQALDNMLANRVLTTQEHHDYAASAAFTILLRNEILHVNQGTADSGITHLDTPTKKRVWDSTPEYFRAAGAASSQEIGSVYEIHRRRNCELKEKLWNILISEETERKGEE